VLAELAGRLGRDLGVLSGAEASRALFAAVPFYAGLTLEEIGGRGVRWQERASAAGFPAPGRRPRRATRLVREQDDGTSAEALARYRSLWDAAEVQFSPALAFLFPRGAIRLAPAEDGRRAVVGA
jgi:NADH-quinone oxidoreductase subunit G